MIGTVVLASGNKNKHKEFSALLAKSGVTLVFSDDKLEVDENGESFMSNALLKARAWSVKTGMPALADDSGITVRALNGLPGVRSARIIDGSDSDRNKWLLNKLDGEADRHAEFVAALALCDACGGWTVEAEACCPGTIAYEEKGSNGFGYDPIFIPEGYSQTLGELSPEIKLKISHRSVALRRLLYVISADYVVKSKIVFEQN